MNTLFHPYICIPPSAHPCFAQHACFALLVTIRFLIMITFTTISLQARTIWNFCPANFEFLEAQAIHCTFLTEFCIISVQAFLVALIVGSCIAYLAISF